MTADRHRIWRGSFARLEQRLLLWAAAAREDPLAPLLGLVPSNALARRLAVVLLGEAGAHANLHLLTLLDLAGVLAGGGKALLDEGGRLLLVAECLAASPEPAFREGSRREGFLAAAAETLRDLREGGVRPSRTPPALAALQRDYEGALGQRGLVDREGLLSDAAARVSTSPVLDGTTPLFVYGFYDLNPLQRTLVASLAARSPLAVFFPWVEGEAGAYARPTLEWLQELLAAEAEPAGDGPEGPLARAAARLFRLPEPDETGAAEPSEEERGAVRLLTAPGPEREAEAVALALLEEHEEGIPWQEMAVLLRNPASLDGPLQRALRSRGVPFRSVLPSSLGAEPLGALLGALLRCLEEGFPWRPAAQLLGSPFLKVRDEAADPAAWPSLVARSGVVGSSPAWAEEWEDALRRLEIVDPSPQAGLLREAARGLLGAAAAVARDGAPSRLAGEVLRLFHAWFHLPPVTDEERGAREAEAWETVCRLLREAAGLDRVRPRMKMEEFAAALRGDLAAAPFRPRRPATAGVSLLGLMAARGLSFEVVVLPGMNEGLFPRPVRQDPLLPDRLRPRAGLPEKARGHLEERLLFSLSLQAARRRLVLSRQRSDRAGRESSPSPFLRELARALYGPLVYEPAALEARMEADGMLAQAPVSALEESRAAPYCCPAALARVAALNDAFGPGARFGCSALDRPSLRRALQSEEGRWSARLTPWDGLVGAEEGLFPGGVLSPTRFEDYGRCPFLYFCRHLLGVEPLEGHPGWAEVSPLDRGSLTHDVLEALFTRLRAEGRLPLAGEDLPAARETAGEVAGRTFASWRRDRSGVAPLVLERERRLLQANVEAVLEREAEETDWVPAHFEASFGLEMEGLQPPSTAEPLRLDLASGAGIGLRGRIDRIDRHAGTGEARIIDYKTGKGPRWKGVDPWREDRYQLSLYWLAARDLLLDGPVTGALYLQLDRGVRERRLEGLDEERLLRTVEVFAEGIAGGRFFLRPGDHCRWCDFAGICRKEPVWRAARKVREDDAARPYREVKGL